MAALFIGALLLTGAFSAPVFGQTSGPEGFSGNTAVSVDTESYDLARIVERALERHLGVRVAQLQYAAAEERLIQQRAPLRPSLTVGARPQWFETPVPDLDALGRDELPDLPDDFNWMDCMINEECDGLGEFLAELVGRFGDDMPQKLRKGRGHSITLSGSVSLWRSPLQMAVSEAASLQLQHADVAVIEAASGAIMQSIDAYFGVLRAEKAAHIAELALQETEVRAEETRAKVASGTATRVDLLQIDAERYGAEAQVMQARGEVTVARMTLNSALGLDLSVPLYLHPPTDDAVPRMNEDGALRAAGAIPTINEALTLATERGDVRRARTDWEMAGAGATIAAEQAKPGVQLFGTRKWPDVELTVGIDRHGYLGGSVTQSETYVGTDRVDGDPASWAAGIELSWPLVDGGERRAKVEEARLQARQAELYYEHVRQTAQTEVLAAHTRLKAAEQAVIGAGQGIEAATEAVHVARSLTAAGAATEAAVVRAQLALARAEQGYFDALYGATMARTSYMQAAGVLVDYWLRVLDAQESAPYSWNH